MNLFERIGKALFKDIVMPLVNENKALDEIVELSKSVDSNVRFFKDAKTGKLRWIAAWSSNYLDDDYPPDIISEKSHVDFIERVERGLTPYPELWHWHVKGTKWGMSDWLAYDGDYGIVWASGTIDEGHEKEALALLKSKIKLGVSHGMKEIVREPHDNKVIAQHTTYEISDLPLRWAANKMTALFITEKNSMEVNMLSDEKKQYLRDAGLPDEEIESLDDFGKQQSEKFSSRARKDKQTDNESDTEEVSKSEVVEQETVDAEQTDESADLESEKANGETGEETEQPEDAQKEEEQQPEGDDTEKVDQISVIKDMFEKSFEQFGDGVVKALERIEERVLELEKANEKREKREKEREFEPLSTAIFDRLSVIGSKEAELDDSDSLKEQKPEETESKNDGFGEANSFSEFLAKSLFGEK